MTTKKTNNYSVKNKIDEFQRKTFNEIKIVYFKGLSRNILRKLVKERK